MSADARLVRALVACYPPGWRRRYGDEYAQLLNDMRVQRSPALIADSLRGAARAYGGVLMDSSMTAVVWAAGLFTVAGIGFAKLAEDLASRGGAMYPLLVAAAAVALLAVVIAALPSAVALLRRRDGGVWKYVAVPLAGVALWYGILRVALVISGDGVHSGPNVAAFLLIAVAGIAVVAATAWAAATVLRRVPASRPARLRGVAVMVVAACMAVATVAALIWGLRVRSGDPAWFSGGNGIMATPFAASWVTVVAALATATALAVVAARREWATTRPR